ncbi:hypothetical protein BT96DRAFT_128533 [Gymnopus androsaceus JB14]|uniref:Uncharacterized protein n=1 Tax=Gymnopus androsaceus JB14 TaxID=1447944 RepID=A0A6A4IBE3_9AGAR|nr:hypothetical protein BT96DRAFT_128533 [Gymnopus androsaceus JB14]
MFLASKTHIISTATLSKKRISQASSDLNHPFNGLEPSSVLFITSTPWCNSTINIAINGQVQDGYQASLKLKIKQSIPFYCLMLSFLALHSFFQNH